MAQAADIYMDQPAHPLIESSASHDALTTYNESSKVTRQHMRLNTELSHSRGMNLMANVGRIAHRAKA